MPITATRLPQRPNIDPYKPVRGANIDPVELEASILKDDFYRFVKRMWSTIVAERPVWNWHIRKICKRLGLICKRIFNGIKKRFDLVVNVPPGMSKSLLMSVFLPAWCVANMPSFRFIGASYSYDLQMDLSSKCRDVIESEDYQRFFPHVKLRDDQNTKRYFKTTKGGFRFAVGMEGSITGFHAHLIVIDDPLDPNMAASDVELKRTNNWIKDTLSSRKVSKTVSVMVLVMQRLHEDDPTAHFLTKKRVRHVKLPAEVTDGVVPKRWGRYYRDGLLDRERLPKDELEELERDLGPQQYAAQYRQSPVPPGGAMFDVERLKVGVPGPLVRVARFWDKATTAKKTSAYTAGVLMGVDADGRYWVLDVVRGRWNSYDRERKVRDTAELDVTRYGELVEVGIEQEGGSGGKDQAEDGVRQLAGYRVKVVKSDASTGGKERRAEPLSAQVNGGNVYLSSEGKRTWHKDYIAELRGFPFSRYKDQVDASSGSFSLVHRRRLRSGALRSGRGVRGSSVPV